MSGLANPTMSIVDVLPPLDAAWQYYGWWGAGHMLLRGTAPEGVETAPGNLPYGLIPGLLDLEWSLLTLGDLGLPEFGERQPDGTRHASLPVGTGGWVAPSLLFYGIAATEATGLRIAWRPGKITTLDGEELDGGHVIGLARDGEMVGFIPGVSR